MDDTIRAKLAVIDARVARGAALLDLRWPGWRSEIDLDRFHIGHSQDCVLGQLYGDYAGGLRILGLTLGIEHGFSGPHGQRSWVCEITTGGPKPQPGRVRRLLDALRAWWSR